jgi:hypothetical protein
MKIEYSWRYGVVGVYFDREQQRNLPWLYRRITRIYPLPFIRISFFDNDLRESDGTQTPT